MERRRLRRQFALPLRHRRNDEPAPWDLSTCEYVKYDTINSDCDTGNCDSGTNQCRELTPTDTCADVTLNYM